MSAASPGGISLRTKLALFAAALIVIPGMIYGALTLSSSRQALAKVVGRQLVEEARSGADRLAGTLRSEQARLQAVAAQDVMREIRINDLDKRISSLLISVKRGCTACADLVVLDFGGRVVASSNPALIGHGADPAPDAPASITGPTPSAGGAALLRLSLPIPDPDAPTQTLGRLMAELDWTRATEVIARVRENLLSVGLDSNVLILDAQGVIIGGALRAQAPWKVGERAALRLPAAPADAGTIDDAAGMLLGHAALPADLPAWTIVIAEPLAEAYAPARRMVRQLALALTIVLLLVLALALFAARRVTRPLGELTAAATEVGRGARPTSALPVRSRDEIGTLTTAFNRMAADLRRAEHDLVEAAKFSFVGELAAGVAHEVRTPLGVLRSSAQLLQHSLAASDAESHELLRMLRDEVDRIERVVSALLDLGRPREMRAEPAPLGQILFRAADFVEVQARQKRIAIRRQPLEPDPVVLCDPELIYQVVLNLLVNAVQILPEGGAIELRLLPARDGFAGFEVRDNGPGMSEAVRARIFEPFFTRRVGGAGLGLTFVQRVVHEHRGRVAVDSALGRGTVFRVNLPLDQPGHSG